MNEWMNERMEKKKLKPESYFTFMFFSNNLSVKII